MSYFSTKNLIEEVKARPGIYNSKCLVHPTRDHKRRLWHEVAERLTPEEHWESYTEVEKEARADEITNKWKHIRDHFYREIKLQEAGEAHKKRKYIYFDDMEFMRPFVGFRLPPNNKRSNKSLDSSLEYSQECESNNTEENDERESGRKTNSNQLKHDVKSAAKKPCTKNSKVLKKSEDEVKNPTFKIRDGDISFSLSLVPTFRKMGDGLKLKAKIEILKILHRYIDHIERQNSAKRPKVLKNKKTAAQNRSTDEEMDEEEYDETVNVKVEQYDDPLNGSKGNGSDSKNTWWT